MQKKVLGFVPAPQGHWVGDGFPVRSLFGYAGLVQHLRPFLLLDYAGPAQFEPASRPRGEVWDVRVGAGAAVDLRVPSVHTAAIALFKGSISVNGSPAMSQPGVVVLDRADEEIRVQGAAGATFLLLSGEPIAEPIVGHGPFVMNSRAEIEAAMTDFNAGKFGRMPPAAAAAVDASAGAKA